MVSLAIHTTFELARTGFRGGTESCGGTPNGSTCEIHRLAIRRSRSQSAAEAAYSTRVWSLHFEMLFVNEQRLYKGGERFGYLIVISVLLLSSVQTIAQAPSSDYLFNDTHFHLTNYVQEGTNIRQFLKIMGDKAGRVALFGIPLQQQ